MSDDASLLLLSAGPVGGIALYWALYRYYRNTDKSHGFERETRVEAQPVTGDDAKTGEIKGTRESRTSGDNVGQYRQRVQRIEHGSTPEARASAPGPGGMFGSAVERVLGQFRSGGS